MPDDATLPALLHRSAALSPDAPALIGTRGITTFAGLEEQSRRVAGALAETGVGPGERVLLWLPDSPAHVVLHFALARLGAIAVAVNARYRAHELADLLTRTGARMLALGPALRGPELAAVLGALPGEALAKLDTVLDCWSGTPPPEADGLPGRRLAFAACCEKPADGDDRATPTAGCVIFTTSGTTHAPKLVLHAQGGIVRHACHVAPALGYDDPDAVLLQAVPLCGVFGYSQLMAALAAGRPTVLTEGFDASGAVALIERHRVTHCNGSDAMFDQLLEADRSRTRLASLRRGGFAAFSATERTDLVQLAATAGLTLHGLYGMSEAQALFASQPPDARPAQRAKAGGAPVSAEHRVRVRDPESGTLAGPGVAGEIELAGPSLMLAYYGDPDATAAALTDDGYLRTGDLGYLEEDSRLVFLARIDDVLRLSGYLVSPREIESVIEAHPTVAACQVIGTPTAGGLRPVAFVTLQPTAAFVEDDLVRHCQAALAKYKWPVRFVALGAFPTTASPNGVKVQRHRLRELAAALLAGS